MHVLRLPLLYEKDIELLCSKNSVHCTFSIDYIMSKRSVADQFPQMKGWYQIVRSCKYLSIDGHSSTQCGKKPIKQSIKIFFLCARYTNQSRNLYPFIYYLFCISFSSFYTLLFTHLRNVLMELL